jgi:hypothetical protein
MEAKRRDICTLVSIAIATLYQKKTEQVQQKLDSRLQEHVLV